MRLIAFFIAVFHFNFLSAQEAEVITIKAGEDASVLYQHVYRYPKFIPGKVYLINGDSAGASFNYNLASSKVEFIGDKKDTLTIADENSVKYIVIANDTFYFGKETYLRHIAGYGFTQLLERETLKIHDEQKIGAFGQPRPTHNIDNSSTAMNIQTIGLQLNKDILFSKEKFYFITVREEHLPSNKKNIYRLLNSKERSFAEAFIVGQAIDLKKQEDLQKLFAYILKLKKK